MKNNAKIQNSSCLSFDIYTKRTLVMLLYSLRGRDTVIVTNEDDCAKEFYLGLKKLMSSDYHQYSQYKLNLQHFIYRKKQLPHQTSGIVFQNLENASLIVLLVSNQHSTSILTEMVNRNSKSLALWVIPSLQSNMASLEWQPYKVLTFKIHSLGRSYRRLGAFLPHILDHYEKWNISR